MINSAKRRATNPSRIVAALAAATVLLAGCAGGGGGGGAGSKTTTLKFQEIFAPGEAFADASKAYGDAVTEATGGTVTFEYFWSNSVAPTDEVAAAMNDGLLDMGRIQPPASPADYPIINWLSSASNLNTASFPAGLLQKVGAHLELFLNSQDLEQELGKLGIRYIAPLALVQQYDLLCKKPVTSLADLKGRKIRTAGQAWVDEAKNLGAQPVTLLPEEIYEGYQRGIVDCVMTYPTHYINSGLWELGGYYVPLQLNGWNQDGLTISKAAWDKLDENQRREMYRAVRTWLESFISTQIRAYWRFATEAPQHGVTLGQPLAEVQTVIDRHHEEVLAKLPTTAPKGVSDPGGLLDRYADLHDKWLGIVKDLGFDTEGQGLQSFLDSLDDPTKPPAIDLDPWLDKVMAEAFGEKLG